MTTEEDMKHVADDFQGELFQEDDIPWSMESQPCGAHYLLETLEGPVPFLPTRTSLSWSKIRKYERPILE